MNKILFIIIFLLAFPVRAETVGWISDIHAGKEKDKVNMDSRIVYPNMYQSLLKKTIRIFRVKGIKNVIITGDIIESKKSYRRKVLNIFKKKRIKVIAVDGNHDGMKMNYFTKDVGNTRVVVLDTNYCGPEKSSGGICPAQLRWLNYVLNTNKDVLIASHQPIFDHRNGYGLFPIYNDFKRTIEFHQNVKMMISGHQHKEHQIDENGITYRIANAFSDGRHPNFYFLEL